MPNIHRLLCALLAAMALQVSAVQAQEVSERDILVRNVTLMDPVGVEGDKLVNVIIRDGILDVITEDKVSREEADQIVNANGGFILGKMETGQLANFMVLSSDPRTDFEVLLDTKTYATFAMHDGLLIKNWLLAVPTDSPTEDDEDEPTKASWLAYTPPPFVVPLNYADTSKWNRFESKAVSGIFIAGLVLDRMNWLSQNDVSEHRHPLLDGYSGGEIRGLRVGVVGTVNFEKPWIYTIFGATNAFDKGFEIEQQDNFTLFDWRLDIPFFKNSVMSMGKQKEPISGERVQSMLFNHMQERTAVADAMLPSRNVGIVWNGASPTRYSSWGIGVFNDWFDADQDFDESATQYMGRLTWAPLRTMDESSLLHFGVGYRYSDAKEGFRYLSEPEFNKSTVFVDTAFGQDEPYLPADKLQTYNAELSWRRGPLWIGSEYTRTDVDNPALGDPSFDGYWVGISYVLTGEMRAYNKKSGTFGGVPVARSVYQNGKGAWELKARWSNVNLTDGEVNGGDMDIASLGLSWWLTPFFGLDLNYRYIWSTRDGLEETASGLNSRLVLLLE